MINPSAEDEPHPSPDERPDRPEGLPRSPTIRDVAAEAGVSRSTVSRVLNGGHLVSPTAQQSVEDAVARIHYVASHSARSLNTGRSGAVALILAEPQERLFEDPTFSVLVRELSQRLSSHHLTLYLTLATSIHDRAAVVDQARGGLMDGLIIASAHGDDPLFRMALDARVPTVICTEPLGQGRNLPHVVVNDRTAARAVVRHLREQGRRRIGCLTGPHDLASSLHRLAGYQDALDGDLDPQLAVECRTFSWLEGQRGLAELLERAPGLDAVFAASDVLASGAMAALAQAGRTVPGDVAVAGFDDSVLATSTSPALTTVRLPFDELAQAVTDLLIGQLRGERMTTRELTCELIVRDSS